MPPRDAGRRFGACRTPQWTSTLLRDLRTDFGEIVSGFVRERVEVLTAISADLMPLIDTLEDLLDGGKRLRPTFAYWGWRSAGGDPQGPILTAAAALEFLQACALVHDDVMDGSDTRRGKPAAHRRLASMHRSTVTWDPLRTSVWVRRSCSATCVLSWSDEMLMASGLRDDQLQAAKPIFDEMRTELMAGQYLTCSSRCAVSSTWTVRSRWPVTSRRSTPSSVPCTSGGRRRGRYRPPGPTDRFRDPAREAFQLRDDLLGVFGDPQETGKPAGDDLREGKRTALVAIAWQNADAVQQDLLRRGLGDPAITADMVDKLRAVIADTGARSSVETMIDERFAHCSEVVAGMDLDPITRQAFERLTVLATRRSA